MTVAIKNIETFSTKLTLDSGKRIYLPRQAHINLDFLRSSIKTLIAALPVISMVKTFKGTEPSDNKYQNPINASMNGNM